MENKITKINLLKTINNDMQFCKYYDVHFRLYNKDKTKYKKGHFIMQIDIFDVQEYFEKDVITQKDWNIIKYEYGYSTIDSYNYDNCKELYKYANNTINDWNNSIIQIKKYYTSIYNMY